MMFSRALMRSARPLAFRQPVMSVFAQRTYIDKLGLDSQSLAVAEESGEKNNNVELWRDQIKDSENGLVLKTDDEIENYVLSIVRGYFRTTKKASLSLDSSFADHGLDSLDAIELVIQVEDELGYMIDAENLELFKKPRHFVNFIKHMEAYKEEFNKLPIDGTAANVGLGAAFPGLPFLSAEKSDH